MQSQPSNNLVVLSPRLSIKEKMSVSIKTYSVIPASTQCGNFRIFKQLRFYVKSLFGILEMQNLLFTFRGSNDFYEFLHFMKAEIYQINKIQCPKIAKKEVLQFLNSPKLISRKIWMTEKSWNFPLCTLSMHSQWQDTIRS